MLKAQAETGELVMLSHLPRKEIIKLRKQATFYCPACQEQVIIKAGTEVVAHFAHQAKSDCSYDRGGEGEYHEQGKHLLYQWLTAQNIQAELEVYVPEIKQRPDILVELHGKRIAIEFQCAKVSNQIIRQRNIGYKTANIVPIWILGKVLLRRYNKHVFQINRFTLQFLHQFSPESTATLFYFCPKTLVFSSIHDVHITGAKQAIGKFVEQQIVNMSFKALFIKNDFTKSNIINKWFQQLSYYRRTERGTAFSRHLHWRQWLYEQGIYLDALPSTLFIPVRSQHRFKTPLYDWQSRVLIDFLHHLELGEQFSFKTVRMLFQAIEVNQALYPLIKNNSHPIYEYLEYLTLFGVLEKVNEQVFQKINVIGFYRSIDEALAGDKKIFQAVNRRLSINIITSPDLVDEKGN